MYVHNLFIFLFFICLEATFGQDTYKTDFRHCYDFFSKVVLQKLLYHSYVKVSSQELRDTLTAAF